MFGDRDYVGKSAREAFPELEGQNFFELLDRVYVTGERFVAHRTPIRLERPGAAPEERFLDFIYEPVIDEAGRVTGIFVEGHDGTDAHRAEAELRAQAARQAFRLNLEERLRSLADPVEVIAAASEALGRYLEVGQVVYAAVEPGDETVLIEREWSDGVMESITGRHRLNDYGEKLIHGLRRGEIAVIDDVRLDPRTSSPEALAAFDRTTISAFMNVPLVKNGRLVAVFGIHSATPREWSAEDAALAGEVAERTWDAVERARAEARVRESEERFRLMADSSPALIWVSDADAKVVFANKRYEEVFGHPADEMHGEGWRQIVQPDDLEAHFAEFLTALNARTRFRRVTRVTDRNGRPLWLHCEGVPRYHADGAFAGYVGVNLDITDAVRAETELRESEQQLRLATEAAEVGLWDLNASSGELFWPPRVKAMFGISPDASISMADFHAGIHPDDRDRTEAAFAAALDPEMRALYDVEYRTVGKEDGLVRWVAAKGRGVFDGSGKCVRVIGTAIDISSRKQAEAALRESETRFREIADAAPVLIWISDTTKNCTWFNRPWLEFTGRTLEQEHGFGWAEGVHPEDYERCVAVYDAAFDRREPFRMDYRLRRSDGEWRIVDDSGVPRFADGGVFLGYIGACTDVTAARRAEQAVRDLNDTLEQRVIERTTELEQAQEALRQSQKLEAMGQLTGGVAHDFNNLLTPIVGSLDMLVRRGLGSERERRLIDGALQSAERAKTLVQRLLAFARRQPLQPSAVDVKRLVEGMAELIASTSGPKVDVRVELPDDLPPAVADANQLEMAVLNLAVNARDSMPSGGVLTLSAARESVRPDSRSKLREGDYVRLSVTDTGVGMDEVTMARAIEPFFSTKGVGKGTGLGLSMVHGLALQLNGGLTIASRPGEGTSVELWLPVSSASVPADDQTTGTIAAPQGLGKALLVDDEDLVRMSTADMLMDLGFEVIEARSAEEALRLVREGLAPALLVTDHLMPGMSGAELARSLRLKRPELPVLIVSGYAEAEGVAPDLPRLTKPFRKAELAASLAALTSVDA